jgi:hypothetical protein
MIVTTRDLFTVPGYSKRAGFCRNGARQWFAAHDLDWTDFVKHGIDAEILKATGDALALMLVAWACKRAEQSNG